MLFARRCLLRLHCGLLSRRQLPLWWPSKVNSTGQHQQSKEGRASGDEEFHKASSVAGSETVL
jgi:hypothetical protein